MNIFLEKTNHVVTVRIGQATKELITKFRTSRNINESQYLKLAIQRQLDHDERGINSISPLNLTDRELIILHEIVKEVKAKSALNSNLQHFEQSRPLEIPMELAEYKQLDEIILKIGYVLQSIPKLVNSANKSADILV